MNIERVYIGIIYMEYFQRIKILLVKDDLEISDEDLIIDVKKIQIQYLKDFSTNLYYKHLGGQTPKWYKRFLQQNDDLSTYYLVGLVFKEIIFQEKKYKFAISFGGGDAMLKSEMLEPRFGLLVALNLSEKIISLSKSSIGTTL